MLHSIGQAVIEDKPIHEKKLDMSLLWEVFQRFYSLEVLGLIIDISDYLVCDKILKSLLTTTLIVNHDKLS